MDKNRDERRATLIKAFAAACVVLAGAIAAPAAADPLVPAPYGPGFTGGIVVGPRDGCRTVVHCAPGNFANRPAHRRYYDNYFDVPAPRYSGQRALRGNPAISGTVTQPSAHLRWCSERYRSYRASDNSYQPLSGPRKPCIPPE